MEQITKNFKLICGALIILCCLLPFISVSIMGFSVSANGFALFKSGLIGLLGILLILAGGGALIFLSVTKKDIEIAPKFTLSFCSKFIALAGCGLSLICVLSTTGAGLGFGLILCTLVSVAVFLEDKVIAALNK